MKIAALANGVLKEELLSKIFPATVELFLVDSFSDLLLINNADVYFDFHFTMNDERIRQLNSLLPKPVFVNSVIHTLQEINQPFFRINAWPTFLKRNVCEIVSPENQNTVAEEIMGKLEWTFQVVSDTPGMISATIIAMIINEAYYTFEDQVSTKNEIDVAMTLGTNYPYGPFEWSEKIGLKNIYELLKELSKTNSRYTISKKLEEEINK
jgi:3-hydroxybutyryl-CoA dehydrogenase